MNNRAALRSGCRPLDYVMTREDILEVRDLRIHYFIGRACCGPGGYGAVIAGHIVEYRSKIQGDGRYVSGIIPVPETEFEAITCMLRRYEGVWQVHFSTLGNMYKVMY